MSAFIHALFGHYISEAFSSTTTRSRAFTYDTTTLNGFTSQVRPVRSLKQAVTSNLNKPLI